jgi:hypothetical protein
VLGDGGSTYTGAGFLVTLSPFRFGAVEDLAREPLGPLDFGPFGAGVERSTESGSSPIK